MFRTALAQWLFLVPLKGGISGIVHPPIGRKNATYIPLIVLAFWGVICYLPPFRGTRNNHWLAGGFWVMLVSLLQPKKSCCKQSVLACLRRSISACFVPWEFGMVPTQWRDVIKKIRVKPNSPIRVFPKIWENPQIIHFNRVFHYFHHPFWGFSPYFWFNTYK